MELIGQPWQAEQQPKPRVDGLQIARITDPKGEDIYCDIHGRIKIQFPWALISQYNENTSCWIRVIQDWTEVAWTIA